MGRVSRELVTTGYRDGVQVLIEEQHQKGVSKRLPSLYIFLFRGKSAEGIPLRGICAGSWSQRVTEEEGGCRPPGTPSQHPSKAELPGPTLLSRGQLMLAPMTCPLPGFQNDPFRTPLYYVCLNDPLQLRAGTKAIDQSKLTITNRRA